MKKCARVLVLLVGVLTALTSEARWKFNGWKDERFIIRSAPTTQYPLGTITLKRDYPFTISQLDEEGAACETLILEEDVRLTIKSGTYRAQSPQAELIRMSHRYGQTRNIVCLEGDVRLVAAEVTGRATSAPLIRIADGSTFRVEPAGKLKSANLSLGLTVGGPVLSSVSYEASEFEIFDVVVTAEAKASRFATGSEVAITLCKALNSDVVTSSFTCRGANFGRTPRVRNFDNTYSSLPLLVSYDEPPMWSCHVLGTSSVGYATITPQTPAGTNLLPNTVYRVKENVTIEGAAGQSALVLSSGTTVIDIDENCTLRLRGGNGKMKDGGGAGIHVPEGANLIVTGKGVLDAVGGDAAAGSRGEKGREYFHGNKNAESYGGAGGPGGGGAGAGIGTAGGAGAIGGDGGSLEYKEVSVDRPGTSGKDGKPAALGQQSASVGLFYLLGEVTARLTGGREGKDGEMGQSGSGIEYASGRLEWKKTKFFGLRKPALAIFLRLVGAGGGGGSGAGGERSWFFGPGGTGGASGAGGGSGAVSSYNETIGIGIGLISTIKSIIHNGVALARSIKAYRKGGYIAARGGVGASAGRGSATPGNGEISKCTSGDGVFSSKNEVKSGRGGEGVVVMKNHRISGKLYCAPTATLVKNRNTSIGHYRCTTEPLDSRIPTILTFDKQGGNGGPSTLTSVLAMPLPVIEIPKYGTHHFMGYYSEPNGAGTQYYNGNGTPQRLWDRPDANVTLYAHWATWDRTRIRVDGKNPFVATIPGVSVDHSTGVVTVTPVIDPITLQAKEFEGYHGHYQHIITGSDEEGARIEVASINAQPARVLISNLVIRLPARTAATMPADSRLRPPLFINGVATDSAYVNFMGENNVLEVAENGESTGGPATAVPAVLSWGRNCIEADRDPTVVSRLRLSAAGGAPAIQFYGRGLSESTLFHEKYLLLGRGSYELMASALPYDSGRPELGAARVMKSPAIGVDNAVICEANYYATVRNLKVSDPFYQGLSALKTVQIAIDGGNLCCVRGETFREVPLSTGQKGMQLPLGEVIVDVSAMYTDRDVVSVTDFNVPVGELQFVNLTPIRGKLHLWMPATELRFRIGSTYYRATPKLGETVYAEMIDAVVSCEETGALYDSFAEAIQGVRGRSSATLRLLTDITNEVVLVRQPCSTLVINGDGHLIANTVRYASAPMFDVATDQTLVISNAMLSGFHSARLPMIRSANVLRLEDCDFDLNSVSTNGALIEASSTASGVGFAAVNVNFCGNVCQTAVRLVCSGESSAVWSHENMVDRTEQETLHLVEGPLHVTSAMPGASVRLGPTGRLVFDTAAPSVVGVTFDDPSTRSLSHSRFIENSAGHPVDPQVVFVNDCEYFCRNDGAGNTYLMNRRGIDFIGMDATGCYEADDYAFTNSLPMVEFATWREFPTTFGPTSVVDAVRKVCRRSGDIVEDTYYPIVIAADRFVDLGSIEVVFSNAVDYSENVDCEPVTLTCPVTVSGTLKLGNIRLEQPVHLEADGELIVGETDWTSNDVISVYVATTNELNWRITSTDYSLEELLQKLCCKNPGWRFKIGDDRIVVERIAGVVAWIGDVEGERLYPTTDSAFAVVGTNETIHLLTRVYDGESTNVVPLAFGTCLETNHQITVDSARLTESAQGATSMTRQNVEPTVLDATTGDLTLKAGAEMLLTNVVVRGTLQVTGPGVLDLAGWTSDPLAIRPMTRGLVARRVPEGKLVLGEGVTGTLHRVTNGDVYYGKTAFVWGFRQTGNGIGVLTVTNLTGEVQKMDVNPGLYPSIPTNCLAHVRVRDEVVGVEEEIEVFAFYCNLDTAECPIPETYTCQYLSEDGTWKPFERIDVSQYIAELQAIWDEKPTAKDGTEQVTHDENGNVVTNKIKKMSLQAKSPRMLGSTYSTIVSFFPMDAAIDFATGEVPIRIYRDRFISVDSPYYESAAHLLNENQVLDSVRRNASRVRDFNNVLRGLSGSMTEGVTASTDAFLNELDRQVTSGVIKHLKGKSKAAIFATHAGIRMVCSFAAGMLKNMIAPVQYKGKHYMPDVAVDAYELCIKDNNKDAYVHYQWDCEVPSYKQTNGVLRLSGTFEGGWKSVFYGMVTNGRQYTSSTETTEFVCMGLSTGVRWGWAIFSAVKGWGFVNLAKNIGNAAGYFLSGLIEQLGAPYCAYPDDKSQPLITVSSGCTLLIEDIEPNDSDSGPLVRVKAGGEASIKNAEFQDGYSLDTTACAGIFTVDKGGKMTLENVTATDCDLVASETGATLKIDGGSFDGTKFLLKNGPAMSLASKVGDLILVSGQTEEGQAFAWADKTETKDWIAFRSSAHKDGLVAEVKDDKVVWALKDPIGWVQNADGSFLQKVQKLSEIPPLVEKVGDGAIIKLCSDVSESVWSYDLPRDNVVFDGCGYKITLRDIQDGNPLFSVGSSRSFTVRNLVLSCDACADSLFVVSGKARLTLEAVSCTATAQGEGKTLARADGGSLIIRDCLWTENSFQTLVKLAHQSACTSAFSGFSATNNTCDYVIRTDSTQPVTNTVFVSGDVTQSGTGLYASGTNAVSVSGAFVFGQVELAEKASLAFVTSEPAAFSVKGGVSHLDGVTPVIDNGRGGVAVHAAKVTSLNAGYTTWDAPDGNVYLRNPNARPPKCLELVYDRETDVFSTTNGVVPTVGETNWMARTISGTNATFNLGRLARDTYVNSTNADIIVNCHGWDYRMEEIGAVPSEKTAAYNCLTALVDRIERGGTAWFERATVLDAAKAIVDACVTKTELSRTAADMETALLEASATFLYDGRFYLQNESSEVFNLASACGKNVYLLRDAKVDSYQVAAGRHLQVVGTNDWMSTVFSNSVVYVDLADRWLRAIRYDERCDLPETADLASNDIWYPAFTVLTNGTCSLTDISIKTAYPEEGVIINEGGKLIVAGKTSVLSVEAYTTAIEATESFSGRIGFSGFAGTSGFPFGVNRSSSGGFFSNRRSFDLRTNGNGESMFMFRGDLESCRPVMSEDHPLNVEIVHHGFYDFVRVSGKIVNAEAGLWYYVISQTNLLEKFEPFQYMGMSPTLTDETTYIYEYRLPVDDVGTLHEPKRFFRLTVDTAPNFKKREEPDLGD